MGKPQRTSSYAKKESTRESTKQNRRWWDPVVLKEGSDRRAAAVFNDLRRIRGRQEYREKLQILHAALYGSADMLCGLGPNSYARASTAGQQQLSLNVIHNNCNAAKSKITKNKPKPTFLGSGGTYKIRKQAESLDKYCEGILYATKAYDKGAMAFLHACIWGRGIIKGEIVRGEKGKRAIAFKVRFPHEIVIDDAEAQHPDELRTVYERTHEDRTSLAEWARQMGQEKGLPPNTAPSWCTNGAEIGVGSDAAGDVLYQRVMDSTNNTDTRDTRDNDPRATADNVLRAEAVRLPSYPGAEDGRRTVCLHDFCIVDEPYELTRFLLSTVAWEDSPMGWNGKGLAEILTGIQIEINTLLQEIQEGHHLIKGHYLVEEGSEVIANHINDDLAAIVNYRGIAPRYEAPNIISPEVYGHLKWLYQVSSEISAISALFSSAQKPAGLNSGKALLTFDDFQTERFADQARNYENLFLDLTEQIILLSKEIAKKDSSFGVTIRDKMNSTFIKWADIDLDRDKLVMELFPTSQLASQPAARLQQVQDMANSQFIDPDTALDLLDYPDTKEYARRRSGWRRCVESDISSIADDGLYRSPEPTYNLVASIPLVRDALNDMRDMELEEERMDMLRMYMVALQQLKKEADAANAPPPPPAPPPGAPGQPPPALGGPPPALPPPMNPGPPAQVAA